MIPRPVAVRVHDGVFTLTPDTTLGAPAALTAVAGWLRGELGPATGCWLPPAGANGSDITLALDPELVGEGYRLEVTASGVSVHGGSAAGVFYGVQTLRQLLPPQAFGSDAALPAPVSLPQLAIEDAPAFGWRGSMLDVGRHFMPKEFVLRYIDLLAMHKLNVLHLHLTDDQGWRIEIQAAPANSPRSARGGRRRSPGTRAT